MSERNKIITRRYFEEVLNGKRHEAIDELIAADCALTAPVIPGEVKGVEVLRQAFVALSATFPDLRFTLHEGVADADRVVWYWTMEGTHRGEWLGVPATGQRLTVTGCDLFEITDGKISRIHIQADYLGAMRQMGVFHASSARSVH